MPRTIYSTAGAFPVALEGTKRVKTFPSGLVLVTQDYAVPRGQENNYAATFAVGQPLEVDSPAIDGLYIFPEPQWVDSGDGFTRLTVTAYGKSAQAATINRLFFPATLTLFLANVPVQQVPILATTVIKHTSNKADQPISLSAPSGEIKFYNFLTGQELTDKKYPFPLNIISPPATKQTHGGFFGNTPIEYQIELERSDATNFGEYDDYTLAWKATQIKTTNFFIQNNGSRLIASGRSIQYNLSYLFQQAANLYEPYLQNLSTYTTATQITVFYNNASVAPDITHNTLPAINGTFSWSKTSGLITYSAPAPQAPPVPPVEGLSVMGPEGYFTWVSVETFPESETYEWELVPDQYDHFFITFENPDGFVCKVTLRMNFS
jgi:hypothetical protein